MKHRSHQLCSGCVWVCGRGGFTVNNSAFLPLLSSQILTWTFGLCCHWLRGVGVGEWCHLFIFYAQSFPLFWSDGMTLQQKWILRVADNVLEVWMYQVSRNEKTTVPVSTRSSQCNVCGQWTNISASCASAFVRVCVCVHSKLLFLCVCVLLISHFCGQ